MKFKIMFYLILLIFLFYFSIFITGLLPMVAEAKTDLSQQMILDYSLNILKHPIETIKSFLEDENPLIYLTFGASTILYIYLLFKLRKKDYENVGEKYGVQGSSRWAKESEIFNNPKQISIVTESDLLAEVKKQMKNGVK